MSNHPLLPNFIIIGAAKAGTTSLAYSLSRHQDIFITSPKEPKFFGENRKNGLSWYISLFENAGERPLRGEASTMYSSLTKRYKNTPKDISSLCPNAKIIYIMRNPYERAISHWRHIKGKNQNVPSFSAILRKAEIYFHPDTCYNSPESAIANTVIGSSCYATILERYLKYFDYSNIHCVAFEELINSPNIVLRQILNFLGADFQGVNSMLDGNKFPLRNDAGKQGRELVAKPILTQSDNSILIKLLHTQAAQALMVLGKTIDFWPQPR